MKKQNNSIRLCEANEFSRVIEVNKFMIQNWYCLAKCFRSVLISIKQAQSGLTSNFFGE
jgi:predicted metal-binding protein